MSTDTPRRRGAGVALMIVAMFCMAAMDATGKFLTRDYAIGQILWLRFGLFFLLGWALAARAGGLREAFRSRQPGRQALRSAVLLAEIFTFIYAFKFLPLADVHAVAACSPLLATALAVPLLGERIGPWRALAIAVGFLGVLMIVRPGSGVFDELLVLPLLGALLWAIYQILTRAVADDGPHTTVLYTATMGLVFWSLIGPFVWTWPDAEGWALLLLTGVLGGIGHLLLILAARMAEMSLLQAFAYFLPVWATLLGFLVFDEWPDRLTLAGAALVIGGGLFALWRERRRGSG